MLEGGLYSGRLIIVCSFCLKEDCSITGGFISAGAGGGGGSKSVVTVCEFFSYGPYVSDRLGSSLSSVENSILQQVYFERIGSRSTLIM